jgi:protein SFI1
MAERRLARAFDAWLDKSLSTRMSRELASNAAREIFSRGFRDRFLRWVRFADASKRDRVALDRVVRRWAARRLAGALDAWALATRERRRLRGVAARVSRRLARLEMSRAFATWIDLRRVRVGARAVLFRVASNARARAFATWAENAREAAGARTRAGRAARARTRRNLRLRAAAFEGWREASHRAAYEGRLVRNMLGRLLAGHLREAFDDWLAEVERRRGERENLKRCLVRKRVAQRWFLRWYWDAFDDDIQVALANILGTAESAMDDAFEPGGLPSAVRGMRPARLAAEDGDGGSDSSSSSDEEMTRGIQNAADAILTRPGGGGALNAKNADDVREARRALAARSIERPAGGGRADPGGMGIAGGFGGLLAAAGAIEEDSDSDESRSSDSEGGDQAPTAATKREEAPGKTVESFNDRYDRVMMAEEEEEEEEEEE